MFGFGGEKGRAPEAANDDLEVVAVDEIGRPIIEKSEETVPAPAVPQAEELQPQVLEEWIDAEPPVKQE